MASFMTPSPREYADLLSERDETITKLAAEAEKRYAAEDVRDELLAALKKAKTFIYYARYELQPGKAVLGDQFPKQEDADNVTAIIDAAIAKAEGL